MVFSFASSVAFWRRWCAGSPRSGTRIALVGEHREARAAFLDSLSPATVAGVTGAVAAAAWVAVA